MRRKSSYRTFAVAFLCIIAAAFGVMLVASQYVPHPSDIVATPR